jgi:cellulose synthase/poly-beta-1,6-N-acetylglucosamine synthase-like glycosyltransferase
MSSGEPDSGLRGKTNALACGVDASRGEILMFTDADCVVPPSWVEATVGFFERSNDVGIVAGFIVLPGETWFDGIQAIDWLMLLSAASGAANAGFPVTAVGNNFSIRRSAYESVGGYRGIPFSITEDFALFRAVTAGGRYRGLIPLSAETTIRTVPCRSWSELFEQRKRWFVGGRDMRPGRILAFAGLYCFAALVATGFLYLPFSFWLGMVCVKWMADFLLIRSSLRVLRRFRLLAYWISFELYFTAYVVVMPLVALFRPKLVWKGRSFGTPPVRNG